MSATNQTFLARFAVAIAAVAIAVSLVAVTVNGSSSGDGGSGTAAAGPVAVDLSEFAITPSTVTVAAGGSLAVTNSGTMVHNLAIDGTSLRVDDINGGETATLDVSSLAPGTYPITCEIAGHADSGMKGTLTVTEAGAEPTTELAAGDGADHGGHDMGDLGNMDPTDPEAQAMNERMEVAMDGGIDDFLALSEKYADGSIEAGNEKIEPTILADGTKRFDLTAAITDWQVSPGNVVKAWTYNGRVPGPWIRVEPGDKVEVRLRNELPISTDIHWHGITVPNEMDGVAGLTQDYIRPYETFTYAFTAGQTPELGMYHAHMHGQVAIVNGLFAMVQVGDVPLPRGQKFQTMDVPADLEIDQEIPMVLNDAGVIGLSLNGKGFPETEPLKAEVGEWLLIHYYNEGLQVHPMHLHRMPQLVVAKDGFPLAAPYQMDTIMVSPGERYSVLVKVDAPGTWAFHCHIVSHAESDDGFIGMVTALLATEPEDGATA